MVVEFMKLWNRPTQKLFIIPLLCDLHFEFLQHLMPTSNGDAKSISLSNLEPKYEPSS
jgi:uncharacterized protein YqhQ